MAGTKITSNFPTKCQMCDKESFIVVEKDS